MGQNLMADADESLLETEGGGGGGDNEGGNGGEVLRRDATLRYARGPTTMG